MKFDAKSCFIAVLELLGVILALSVAITNIQAPKDSGAKDVAATEAIDKTAAEPGEADATASEADAMEEDWTQYSTDELMRLRDERAEDFIDIDHELDRRLEENY